jgi:hypothetical protein
MNERELDRLAYAWVERANNREVWRHMFEVLTLGKGFSLHVVRVTTGDLAGSVVGSLERLAEALQRRFVRTAVRARRLEGLEPPPVQALLAAPPGPCVATFSTTGDSWERISPERVEVALQQINQRRDVLVAQLDGPLFLFVDQDSRQTLIELAPDLWSIRASELRVETGEAERPNPRWLSTYELAGLLGLVADFDTPISTRFVSAERPIPPPMQLVAREDELAQLRALSDGSERRISVYGLAGSGRRSLVARFVAEQGHRWERVVWIDLELEAEMEAGLQSLLMALRPGLPPPRAREDLVAAYLRETRARRVLVVVVDSDSRFGRAQWPVPSEGSLVLLVTGHQPLDEDKAKVRPKDLRQEHIRELWSRCSDAPLPASFASVDLCPAGMIVAAARSAIPVELGTSPFAPRVGGRLTRELSDEAQKLWQRLSELPSTLRGLPATLLDDADEQGFAELLAAGVVEREGDALRVLVRHDFSFIRKERPFIELVRLLAARTLTVDDADAFELQLLRAAPQAFSDLRLSGRGLVQLRELDELLASVRLPWERPDLYDGLLHIAPEADQGRLLFSSLRAELVLHRPTRAHELLHRVRSAFADDGLDGETERTLHRAAFEVALMCDDVVRLDALLLANKLGFEPASLARFEQLGLRRERPSSEARELGARLAESLWSSECDSELAREAVASSETAIRHFGWVMEALVAMQRHDDEGLSRAIAGARLSAEQWGSPLALLRADRLDAEADLLSGDEDHALSKLDALTERHDTCHERLSAPSVRLLARRAQLASKVRAAHESRELADLCSVRARDCGLRLPDVWQILAHVHLGHESYQRAFEAARRWELASDDDPAEQDHARKFAGDVLEREYLAKRRVLERGRPAKDRERELQRPARGWLVWEDRGEAGKREHVSHLIVTGEDGRLHVTTAQRPGLFAASREALWELRWSQRELINHPRTEDEQATRGAPSPEIIPLTDALLVSTSTDVLSVESDWSPFDWQNEGVDTIDRTFYFVASVGPLFFVRCEDFIMYEGAMSCFYDSGFKIIDLEQRRSMTLVEFLGDAEFARISRVEGAQADALFRTDEDWDPDYIGETERDPGLTMVMPKYDASGSLSMQYQFTRAASRGASDGQWSVYTMSKHVTSSYIPMALAPFVRLPPAVRAWHAGQSVASERWGWSVIYDAHLEWCRALFGTSAL